MADRPSPPRPLPRDSHTWAVSVARDGTPREVHALAVLDAEGRAWTWVEGEIIVVDPPNPTRRAGPAAAATGSLASPMPATVVTVLVAVGDRVEAGQTLVLLEAMKMELPLQAPHAGIVTAVACAPGDLVPPGEPLVTLDEVSDDQA